MERCTRGEKSILFTSSIVLRDMCTFPLDVRYIMYNKHTAKIEIIQGNMCIYSHIEYVRGVVYEYVPA